MAHVLVTGGAGFIGSHLVEALVARGDRVRVLDDLSTGRRENLRHLEGAFDFILGSCADLETARRAVQGCEAVFHEAAIPSVPRSVSDPVGTDRANCGGTVTMLEAAREAGVKRFVFAASSAAYGDTPTLPKEESMTPNPLSPYAVQKVAGEHYCRVFFQTHGLETVALRYFNVFGPRQDPKSEYAAVVPRFVTAALKGEPVTVFGDGLQSRDFTPIADAVRANLLALTSPRAPGHVINVARGERITLLELVERIGRIVGRKVEVHHAPPRAGDIKHSLADVTRARELLGYTPSPSLDTALTEVVRFYRG
jgi:UDP-glucose 4-epimerase